MNPATSTPAIAPAQQVRALVPVQCSVAEPATTSPSEDTQHAPRNTLDFRSSDQTLDRYQELITVAGWHLENYRKNPVVQNAHCYSSLSDTIGKSLITEIRSDAPTLPRSDAPTAYLFQRIQFAVEENPMAKVAYGLYKGGFLNAVSVGFIPLRWEDFLKPPSHSRVKRRKRRAPLLCASLTTIAFQHPWINPADGPGGNFCSGWVGVLQEGEHRGQRGPALAPKHAEGNEDHVPERSVGSLERVRQGRNGQIRFQFQSAKTESSVAGKRLVFSPKTLDKDRHCWSRVGAHRGNAKRRITKHACVLVGEHRQKWRQPGASETGQGISGSAHAGPRIWVVQKTSQLPDRYLATRTKRRESLPCAFRAQDVFVMVPPTIGRPSHDIVAGTKQFDLPLRRLVSDPGQEIRDCIRANVANGILCSSCCCKVRFLVGRGHANFVHPLTQPLPPITRLPLTREHQQQQPNHHPTRHQPRHPFSSHNHAAPIMLSRPQRASQNAITNNKFSILNFQSTPRSTVLTIPRFNHSTIQPFNHSTIQPFNHSTIQPMLTTLANLKSRLELEAFDTTPDLILTSLLKHVSARFAAACNRTFDYGASLTYEFRADRLNIIPDHLPIELVTQFDVKTSEAEGWILQSAIDYLLSPTRSVIQLAEPLGNSDQLARVTYSGGYVLPGTDPTGNQTALPDDLEQACVEQVAYWYQRRAQLGLVSASSGGAVVQQFQTSDLLPQVQAVLSHYERWVN